MAQTFVINKNSTLPNLRMEVVNNGRDNFKKFFYAIQAADVTFSMTNKDTGIKKIVNSKAYVIEKENESCDEQFVIEYRWNKRDTSESGCYVGQFNIKFDDNIKVDGLTFNRGNMIVPIAEDLIIVVNDNGIKV